MSELLKKITDLTAGTPADTDIIPYVDLVAGATKKALKSELKGDKGDKGDAATVDAGTTTTLAAGESATVTNSGTTAAAIFDFGIPQGIQGEDGACVESVAFVGNDMVFTLDDDSTVTITDAKITLKGETGETGAKIVSGEFVGDDLVFTLDDNSTATVLGAKTALKGDKGDTGDTGIDWQGAWSAGTYTATQAVSHNGSSWIATTTTTEEPSISATDWDLIALKGTDGAGSGDISGSGTANEIAYFTAEKTIDNLPVATYPSLTELSYVKGVTGAIQTQLGAIQTQLGGKQASLGFTAEDSDNKENSTIDTSTTKYPTVNLLKTGLDTKINNSLVDAKGDIITATADNTPARLGVGDNGKVLTANSSTATGLEWATPSAGGTSLWTAIAGTRASNTTITVATDLTAIFKKGMIVRWQESGVDKVGMVSIPSTYSSPNTTITIIGDTCASIDEGTFKYSVILGAEKKPFVTAGNIGAVATNVANSWYADKPYRVIGAELSVGIAGTTNNTTIDLNKNGTTMFTTKPTLGTTVAFATTPFTADTATSLALGDKVTMDIYAIQTTNAVDLYADLIVFESRFLTLS